MIKSFTDKIFRFNKSEDGTATIEFVIMFPLIMTIFLSAYETGLYMLNDVMLERAADVTVRKLKLRRFGIKDAADLREELCNNLSIVSDCKNSVQVALEPVSTTNWSPFPTSIPCRMRNATIDPTTEPTVNPGTDNELMFVRFCVKIKPFFGASIRAGLDTVSDGNGDVNIFATTAFVNEPSAVSGSSGS